MKVKIQKWEDPLRLLFKRKYKNTKRPIVYLREGVNFEIEIKYNKGLYFWDSKIEIVKYDDFSKLWFWQPIERRK